MWRDGKVAELGILEEEYLGGDCTACAGLRGETMVAGASSETCCTVLSQMKRCGRSVGSRNSMSMDATDG